MARVLFVFVVAISNFSFLFGQSAQPAHTNSVRYARDVPLKNSANLGLESTHGTVNVFLVNKNGLVVVTDSRLSNAAGIVGNGQKLFRIDDRTICTIAGWYSDPGPVIRPDHEGDPSLDRKSTRLNSSH